VRLDPEVCYRALRTRDPRFDGRFFTAVRSTRVYCRPICPAPTPKRENCLFLPCAAAAQEAGYRPCLRCRPEASPGTPAWLGTSATVSRGLRLISDGALDEGSVGDLAARLGIGERHLRRLFVAHLGAPPLAVAHTRRVLFAKRLLDETGLSMTEVAQAAGFSSIRRFNEAIRRAYDRSPSQLRHRRGERRPPHARATPIELKLPYRPPLDWAALTRFLAPRATPGVEEVGSGGYQRTILLDGVQGVVEVRPAPAGHHLLARVRLAGSAPLIAVAERLHLRGDPWLAPRVEATPGVRVPGAWDGFELAVRAVLGQQVSVAAATRLAGRLAAHYGEPLRVDAGESTLTHTFPGPEALVRAEPERLGLPAMRGRAVVALARAAAEGRLRLDGSQDLEDALGALRALPGIGPWTAQVIAMRALREPDAFPAGDLGLRRALGRPGPPASEARLAAHARAWRPWRAYAALLLWGTAG
jgi:AraC family transcriptional regulator of adaptative response / DNA-3-methyladenine glycosylase II